MLFVSWNVNGIRSCLKKDFASFYQNCAADFLCLQEVKAFEEQAALPPLDKYQVYWHAAERPGYSGTAILISYRMMWEDSFHNYVSSLSAQKPAIICGDLNVAHREIDLKNPKSNHQRAGFTDAERDKFTILLSAGFTDSFRHLYPDKAGAYTWWSYMGQARERNSGWRIDYFLVSDQLRDAIEDAVIYSEVLGSDHCPVGLHLKTK